MKELTLQITFARFGKAKSRECQFLADHYASRARAYAEIFRKEEKVKSQSISPSELPKWWLACQKRILMDEGGITQTSLGLSKRLGQWRDQGARSIGILVGGPYGFSKEALTQASEVWSLSSLTLPAELAEVVLSEQLYRALSILGGSPYHHE